MKTSPKSLLPYRIMPEITALGAQFQERGEVEVYERNSGRDVVTISIFKGVDRTDRSAGFPLSGLRFKQNT